MHESMYDFPAGKLPDRDQFPVEIVSHSYRSKLPEIKTPGSAGYDLVTPEPATLEHNQPQLISFGLSLWIRDPALVGMLYIRSSLAKQGVVLLNGAGVIDSDYQGELACLLQYIGPLNSFNIEAGQRLAQLVLTPFVQRPMVVVEAFSDDTSRVGGFGSTGNH